MVYVFLANGFEELEALAPIDVLRRAGVETVTVGIGSNNITAAHGVKFVTDITDDQIKLGDGLEMIVLPGGMPGALNLENSPDVQAAIDYCSDNGRYIAAICAAPQILGHKGLLRGKYCTCFPGFEKELDGAKHTGEPVVCDGNIITAKGAGAAMRFALKLVAVLCSEGKAAALAASLQFK
ncbi:4-methyl-5(b-hydroxyethyl)-thiazole monophosphate biosynthesis [Ruminococcus sp. YE71]|uniref:DJ-1 family glyoxalase III n=1 Tax=unclassified Ruminococcus TaxID=2608920 RepID=UPI0008806789|nr:MULTISPECIES: DJ-1 family glyoxalase III [unclassified Ruminococcus]SDA21095.1 4-methyl-5(b-hydroxyethyl)-thiazole monophosphate biosynthesis [Ruminococcus sp. YE78]SFW33053.1 4-methyl-5(b-hydroxyethyl)-thiazole monophosphate biosynthesis [Ruminococcus sp. YE71]